MIHRSSRILQLIEELTHSLAAARVEHIQRRVRHALALLHAAAESLDELDAVQKVVRAPAPRGSGS